jgi:hypothetical protein
MNYIRDFLHTMDWDDDINNLFERFIEDVNEVPFNTEYEHTPEFRLNQSIINNAYLLRRTIELYPDEQRNILRNQRIRRSSRVQPRNMSRTQSNAPPNIISTPHPPRAPILARFSDNESERNSNYPYVQRYDRYDRYDSSDSSDRYDRYDSSDTIQSSIWNSLDLQLTTNLTDSIFESLFTNFNQFMDDNFNDLEDVKVTLSTDEFNDLDIVSDKTLIENKQCNICLEDLQKEDLSNKSLIQLQCNHIYHNSCIKEWLTKQSTKCPSCRFCCRTKTSTNSE